MSSYVQSLLDEYYAKGILLDANLQLLNLVGTYDIGMVGDGTYNKLSKYTPEDYGILTRLIRLFRRAVTTPHVLTEVSNLAGDLPGSKRTECFIAFAKSLENLEELSVPSLEAARRQEFRFLGLTDSGLAEVCRRFLVVSDDARMIAILNRSGLDALNFNHLRGYLFR